MLADESARVRALPRACSCCAAAIAPGGHTVVALTCTCVAAGQDLHGQETAAAAVIRLPSVCHAASPGQCDCRPAGKFFTKGICKQMHRPPTPQSHSSAHAVTVTTANSTRHQRSPASTLTSTKGDSSAGGGEDTAGADSVL